MVFNKYSVMKKQRRLVSTSQRLERRALIALFKLVLVSFVLVVVVLCGAGFGMIKGILDDSPDVSTINIKPKGFQSQILDKNGNLEMELSMANYNRIYVYYEDIPEQLANAFVAIEDERFWQHNGIDIKGIFRAIVTDFRSRNFEEGASTITQQLIKNQVYNVGMDEDSRLDQIERKIQEQFLAIELEKVYSKETILEYYLNTIYLGHGVNGVEAAANRYFDKSVGDLTLPEMAVIAAITENPYHLDPIYFPEDNKIRRDYILKRMLKQEYITKAEYEKALKDDTYSRIQDQEEEREENEAPTTYYEDAILDQLQEDFMELYDMDAAEAMKEIRTGGYKIYSVQDTTIQKICDDVINNEDYYPDHTSVGLQYKLTLLSPDGQTKLEYDTNTMMSYYRRVNDDPSYSNIFESESAARSAADAYKERMMNENHATFVYEELSTSLQPQASFSVIDQRTGYVQAVTGGRGKKTVDRAFNRATDARRQPGSCFKVVAAFLPYVDSMGSLASCFEDAPYSYEDGTPIKNWYGGYRGWATVRDGIRDSMNIVAVKAITAVTPEKAFDYLLDEGFTSVTAKYVDSNGNIFSDIQQATALGGLTFGVTNLEITAAYAGIANGGVYIRPVFYSKVVDHDGNVVIDYTDPTSRSHRMCKETTAYMLVDAMKDVIKSGTGTPCQLTCGMTAAGKTGTTTNENDIWFCGMTPYYTGSIWMGGDAEMRVSTAIHKDMWRDVMDGICEAKHLDTSADWEAPENLTRVTLCKESGLLPSESCLTVTDYCDPDNVPERYCEGNHKDTVKVCTESHMVATEKCPHTKSYRYSLDSNGKLEIDNFDQPYGQDFLSHYCTLHPDESMHMIETSASDGGSITSSVQCKDGDTVTIFISPSPGYQIASVSVDGNDYGSITNFAFYNVDCNHTVSAVFTPTDAPPTPEQPQQPEETPQQPEETPQPTPPDEGGGEGE